MTPGGPGGPLSPFGPASPRSPYVVDGLDFGGVVRVVHVMTLTGIPGCPGSPLRPSPPYVGARKSDACFKISEAKTRAYVGTRWALESWRSGDELVCGWFLAIITKCTAQEGVLKQSTY